MLINCDCKHEFQDEKYGIGRRVAVPKGSAKNPGEKGYSCTVCGKLSDKKAPDKKAAK